MVRLIVKVLLTFVFFGAVFTLAGARFGPVEMAACTILPLVVVGFLVRAYLRGRREAAAR